jgi:hypothetical protein
MFKAIDYFYRLVGNFGLAILIVTVLVKILFFPLANKSYASMAKMKAVQPEMMAIRERYGDDRIEKRRDEDRGHASPSLSRGQALPTLRLLPQAGRNPDLNQDRGAQHRFHGRLQPPIFRYPIFRYR